MRLGVSTDFGAKTADEWVSANKELGLGTVVFPLNARDDVNRIKEYKEKADNAGIEIAEVGIWRNAIDANPELEKENLQYSIDQLAMADSIGAKCCVNVVGAYLGSRWDGAHRDNFSRDAWNKSVKMIQTIIDEVNPKNTYFTIEPMPWMIPTGPEEYLNLIEDVARDRFAVHMDIINMINCPERYFFPEEFLEKTFSLLHGKIKSCHLKDVNLLGDFTFQLRECACGEGTFPIELYAELASKENLDMPMIIEHLSGDSKYRASVEYVKKRLNIEDKYLLLAVAQGFDERKGLKDFFELSSMLPDNYQIVLLGAHKQEIAIG